MVRLVHPAPAGNGTPSPKRRKGARSPSLVFTLEETRLVRATLENVARAYGGFDVLASAMGVPVKSLYAAHRQRRPSGILAIRLATAAGTTVEAMLSGRLEVVARAPSPPTIGGAS